MERLVQLWFSRWRWALVSLAVLTLGAGLVFAFGGGSSSTNPATNESSTTTNQGSTTPPDGTTQGGATTTSTLMPATSITPTALFEFASGAANGLQAGPATGAVYELGGVNEAAAQKVAKALGVTGTVETVGVGAERLYRIGSVMLDRDGTWYYPSSPNGDGEVKCDASGCKTVPTTTPGGDAVSEATAISAAKKLASQLGVQTGKEVVQTNASVVSVSMPLLRDGQVLGRVFTVSYGPGLKIVKGTGNVASYTKVDDWSLVSVRDAAARLETDPRVTQAAGGKKLTVISVSLTTVDVLQGDGKHYLVPAYSLNTSNGVWVTPAAEPSKLPVASVPNSGGGSPTSVGTLPGR